MEDIPEMTKYLLNSNNNLIRVSGHFERNLIMTQDYTILQFTIRSMIKFHRTVKYILLNFSDEKLNKLVYLNKDTGVIFESGHKYQYNEIIYIESSNTSEISLNTISIIVELSKYIKDYL